MKIQGEYIWHNHPDTDEVFIVLEGKLTIELPDGNVEVNSGELFVVPRGIRHKPSAASECKVMLIEPEIVVSEGGTTKTYAEEMDTWI